MQVGTLQVIKKADAGDVGADHLFGRVDMADLWGPLRLVPAGPKRNDSSPDWTCEMQNSAGAWVTAGAAWQKPYKAAREGYWISVQLAPFAQRPDEKWNLSVFPVGDGESTIKAQAAWQITFRPIAAGQAAANVSAHSSL